MLVEYIREKQKTSHNLFGIPIEIRDNINFDLGKVTEELKKMVPDNAFEGIKKIVVTDMKKVGKGLPFNAYYINNIIYLDNEQDGTMDAVDDIIHELSHHLEKRYHELIYGDKTLESEFIAKRGYLHDILTNNDMNPPDQIRTDLKYNRKIDDYFYNKVGPKLSTFINGLFMTEYAVTSLKEYYGVGFEKYLLSYNNHMMLKKQSPVLFNKIERLMRVLNGEEDKR